MKRFLPILLVLVMLVGMLPVGAHAAEYVLDEVHLRVEKPVAGYAPRFEAWIEEENPHYYISTANKTNFINSVRWEDTTEGRYLTEDDVFIQGHIYCVAIRCNADQCYEFNAQIANNNVSAYYSAKGYVNGKLGVMNIGTYVSEALRKTTVYYTFTSCEAAPAPVSQVSVSGIKTPHHLDAPDYDATVAGNQYRIAVDQSAAMQRSFYNGVGWQRILGGGYTYTMDTEDAFEGGKIYRVSVLLEAVHPYRFAVDTQNQLQVTGTIKGIPATVRDAYGYLDPTRYCIVEYEFPITSLNNYCILSDITITDIDTPLPGRCPDYTATKIVGAHFREMDSTYVKNGIAWYDETACAYLKPTDTFTENHIYTVMVNLQSAENYLFQDDENGNWVTTATINGQPAAVANERLGADKFRADYTFATCQKGKVSQIDVTVQAPILGALGSYDVTFDQAGAICEDRNDGYFEEGVAWWDNQENTYLLPGQRFAPNRSYSLELYLEAETGYTIDSGVSVTINGIAADAWGGGNSVWVTCAFPALENATGWYEYDGKKMYWDAEGNPYTGWKYFDEGWYFFDSIGTMATGWIKDEGKEYYMGADGVMVTGWVKQTGIWYYLQPGSGAMATGWKTINGKTYYFKNNGAMVTGSIEIAGKRYQFDANGVLMDLNKKGWEQENGKWYYYENGGKVSGWKQISNIWYYFDGAGVMQTGWEKINSKWYFFKTSGAMAIGWLQQGDLWYYLDSSGAMVTGTVTINGKRHKFASSGVWQGEDKSQSNQSGWVQESGIWYYYQNGVKTTGWLQVKGVWYYFNGNGAMATGWLQVKGVWYYFNGSGAMTIGWLQINGVWYYFYSSGAMATGSVTVGGKVYNFSASGACLNP